MIIVPTYNEKHNVVELVKRIRSVTDLPVLFVDDSSPDGTAEIVRGLQKTDSNISLLVRPEKTGLGHAYRHALSRVLHDNKSEFVITMDADLSHPPEAIPKIIELLKQQPVVIGSRYIAGGSVENWHWIRRFISRAGSAYARMFTGVPIRDVTAGFVGYHTSALRAIDFSSMNSDGYAFQIEMKYLLYQSGFAFLEFPITFTDRSGGKSKFSSDIVREAIVFPLRVLAKNIFKPGNPRNEQ